MFPDGSPNKAELPVGVPTAVIGISGASGVISIVLGTAVGIGKRSSRKMGRLMDAVAAVGFASGTAA